MRQFAAVLLVMLCTIILAPAQSQPDPLRQFLQNYVGSDDESKTTVYSNAYVDLRDNGKKEVIVYLSSDGWWR